MWTATDKSRNIADYRINYYVDATQGESGAPVLEENYSACLNCAIATQVTFESAGSDSYNSGVKVTDEVFAVLNHYRYNYVYVPVAQR